MTAKRKSGLLGLNGIKTARKPGPGNTGMNIFRPDGNFSEITLPALILVLSVGRVIPIP
jgi:hypothetical protein